MRVNTTQSSGSDVVTFRFGFKSKVPLKETFLGTSDDPSMSFSFLISSLGISGKCAQGSYVDPLGRGGQIKAGCRMAHAIWIAATLELIELNHEGTSEIPLLAQSESTGFELLLSNPCVDFSQGPCFLGSIVIGPHPPYGCLYVLTPWTLPK